MNIDFAIVLYIAAFTLTVFWTGALLIIKKVNTMSRYILSLLLFFISLELFNNILILTELINNIPHFLGIGIPIGFITPPLFYLYVLTLIIAKINFKKQMLHFIPAVIIIAYFFKFFLLSGNEKLQILNDPQVDKGILFIYILTLELIYIFLIFYQLHRHKNNAVSFYSNSSSVNLQWLKLLIGGYILVIALYYSVNNFDSVSRITFLIPSIIIVFIFVLGFFGLRQPEVFSNKDFSIGTGKYNKSGLQENNIEESLHNLENIMKGKKLFLESDLNLSKLAKEISISPNHLSQILNEKLNKTFYDYVNYFRVEEAKKLLLDENNNNHTILAIAYESGFNSKSSFNHVFKKLTSLSPSNYKTQTNI